MKAKRKPPAPAVKRILVVDDHPMTRRGVAELLRGQPGLTVCCETGTARAALALVKANHPDLVLCDLALAERSGLELIKDLHVLHPEVPILVFSMHYESLYAERVLRAGARGYIMKSEGGAKLVEAIRQVLSGGVYLSDVMRDRAVYRFTHGPAAVNGDNTAALSDRELEVFELIGQALGTREIAQRLNVSTSTVETHRAHIKEKLGLSTATELVRAAVEWFGGRGAGGGTGEA
jgi:DNA-binding NarL/FixJ family response regulator